jgi:general secretion pathway protein K
MMGRRMRKDNDGVALILTLLFVVLLTVLVVEFAFEAQVEASYALNAGNEFQAELAARSAVYNGIAILETDRLETELAAAEGGGTALSDSRLSAWASPGTFDPLNDAVMRTTIVDEYSKINLNALVYYDDAGNPLVRGHIHGALIYFFQQRDEGVNAEALVDSLIDWMDEDDEVYNDGAESDFYMAAENPYPCKNGPMDSIDELLLIKGITPELYFGRQDVEPVQLPLSEYLTVHGDWLGRINPNTVHVDLDTGISEVLEAMREGWANPVDDQPLADDVDIEGIITVVLDVEAGQPFGAVGDLSNYVSIAAGAVGEDGREQSNSQTSRNANQPNASAQQGDVLRNMFTVYSHVFRIQGDALLDDILVRNEAYVYRVPQDDGLFELPNQLVGTNPVPIQVPAPEEYYRILEWKVIQ